jgi:hypothetical protein
LTSPPNTSHKSTHYREKQAVTTKRGKEGERYLDLDQLEILIFGHSESTHCLQAAKLCGWREDGAGGREEKRACVCGSKAAAVASGVVGR